MASEIFGFERNDECVCGSGKKYKKCCLPRVEKIEAGLLKAIGEKFAITAEELKFIRIISVMYGVDIGDNEAEADIERLASIVMRTWDDDGQVFTKSEELMHIIIKMLREKNGLKHVRIPGFLLVDVDADTDDDIKPIMDKIIGSQAPERYLLDTAYSLRTDEYTEEEIKSVFHWISLGLLEGFASKFMLPILQASFEDISEAQKKLKERIKSRHELDRNDMAEVLKINAEYPVFEEYFGARELRDVEDDLDEVVGKVSFKFPFYTIYASCLKLFGATVGTLFGTLPDGFHNKDFGLLFYDTMDEFFQKEIIFQKVFGCIYRTIAETEKKTNDEDFKNKLAKIRDFFSILTSTNFYVIKDIFLKSIRTYINTLPQPVEDSGIVAESLEQITGREFFDKYVSYLESGGLEKEVEYIKELYADVEDKPIPPALKNIFSIKKSE